MAKRDIDLLCSHSVEEAQHRHERKIQDEKEEDEEEEVAAASSRQP